MEERPELQNMDEFSDLRTDEPLRGQDSDYLDLLTEIQQHSDDLGVQLQKVMEEISISGSRSKQRYLRSATRLQHSLTKLQRNVTSAIRFFSRRRWQLSGGETNFTVRKEPKEVTETFLRSNSLPDISSAQEPEFNSVQKSRSHNRDIDFYIEQKLEQLKEDFAVIEELLKKEVNLPPRDTHARSRNTDQLPPVFGFLTAYRRMRNARRPSYGPAPAPASGPASSGPTRLRPTPHAHHETTIEQNQSLTSEPEFHPNQEPPTPITCPPLTPSTRYLRRMRIARRPSNGPAPAPASGPASSGPTRLRPTPHAHHETTIEQNQSLTSEPEFHPNQASSGITNNGSSSIED